MIISGFAGVGKSTFAKNHPDIAVDLESSDYKWIFGKSIEDMEVESRKGQTDKILNPDFPDNYFKAITDSIGKYKYIFISMDENIREMLESANIEYSVAYPHVECKQEYIERYKMRSNSENFVNLLESKFEEWILALEKYPGDKIVLNHGEYLESKLNIL